MNLNNIMKLKHSALERRIIEIMGKDKLVPKIRDYFHSIINMRKRMQRDRETKAVKAKKSVYRLLYLDVTGFRDTTPKLWRVENN